MREAQRQDVSAIGTASRREFPPIHPNCRGRIVAVVTFEDGTEAQPVSRKLEEPVEIPMESGILNEEERAAVTSYIGGGSYVLNAKLRDGLELSPYEQEMADALDAALQKLPVYEGTVLRSLDFDRADLVKICKRSPGRRCGYLSGVYVFLYCGRLS